jgi:pyruvate dehydrogenase E2 component (dihydrolipoamide acetyltransferase)
MSRPVEIRVPDIGDFETVEIIEVLVSAGDAIEAEQSLITLESDKASMEIPSTHSGTIADVPVKVGDKISTGDLIATVSVGTDDTSLDSSDSDHSSESGNESDQPQSDTASKADANTDSASSASDTVATVVVPDIGEFEEIEVIELLVSVGDAVALDQSLITLESDKASMEIPSPQAGVVDAVLVSVGDRVSHGHPIIKLKDVEQKKAPAAPAPTEKPAPSSNDSGKKSPAATNTTADTVPASTHRHRQQPVDSPTQKIADESYRKAHASPAVRKFARQLGVDLLLVTGTGPKTRILKEDVEKFVKSAMAASSSAYGASGPSGGAGIPPIPEVDFSKFGEVERVEMTRINVLTAENLHRAWLNLPMVTYHDEADITELEAFRQSIKQEAADRGVRVTGLVFHVKALAATLKEFPRFNSSLSADGASLFYKKYFNIGIAVDTPAGLVVPVLKDVDKKNIYQLSEEMTDLSSRAREKKLKPAEMQGASMTISSLGGIGGTAFTPIVNPPEVAILGITRAKMQPVWDGSDFKPRLMCPLDITYDHRVIDGAVGARFMTHYCKVVGDIRKMLLY